MKPEASNAEIAGELYLSVNTVKTHQRMIYRKLARTAGGTPCAEQSNFASYERPHGRGQTRRPAALIPPLDGGADAKQFALDDAAPVHPARVTFAAGMMRSGGAARRIG